LPHIGDSPAEALRDLRIGQTTAITQQSDNAPHHLATGRLAAIRQILPPASDRREARVPDAGRSRYLIGDLFAIGRRQVVITERNEQPVTDWL
jgi:hypothetical protein